MVDGADKPGAVRHALAFAFEPQTVRPGSLDPSSADALGLFPLTPITEFLL